MPQSDATTPNSSPADDADTSFDLPADMFRSGDTPEETVIVMYKRRPEGAELENAFGLSFTDVGGNAIFEGDIVLASTDEARAAMTDPGARGVGIIGEEFRWKDGIVPIVVAPPLRDRVAAAVAHWEEHTPFRFPIRTDEPDYISFEQLDGCWSRVGRQGNKQVISLADTCGLGSAIHEIGHALGLWHEQSRDDRDEFVTIVMENVIPQFRHNFNRHILDGDDLGNYDYGSIMHYPATAFAINRTQPTIVAKGGQPIGQRQGLSAGDIASIRLMYPDLAWQT